MENVIVAKFGEYTFATPERIRKAAEILKSNPERCIAMAVAPGRRTPDDIKITDMLCMAHTSSLNGENFIEYIITVKERFSQIIQDLKIEFDIESEFSDLKKNLFIRKGLGYVASRGEYIMAKIFAKFLGWDFIDSAKIIFFDKSGELNVNKTMLAIQRTLKNIKHAVIPGFYGSIDGTNDIKTFEREDCDSSAALVTAAIKANLLERWTEPKIIYSADPAIVNNPLILRTMTYGELVELTYMGLEIVNNFAIFQLKNSGIPMSIKLIDNPEDPGTLIANELPTDIARNPVTCIAGRKSYRLLHIEKFGINKTAGFMEKLFSVFSKRRISCEQCLTGIHKISLLIKHPVFDLRRNEILNEIKSTVEPDNITVKNDISLIAVIGNEITKSRETFRDIFDALITADIKICITAQESDNTNLTLGVHDKDYERAIKALYESMFREGV